MSISKIYNYTDLSDTELLKDIASIEKKSEHPIAMAIVNKAIENKTDCLLILHSICKKGHPLEHDLYSWKWEKFEALCVYIHSLEVKGKLKSVLSKDLILK